MCFFYPKRSLWKSSSDSSIYNDTRPQMSSFSLLVDRDISRAGSDMEQSRGICIGQQWAVIGG